MELTVHWGIQTFVDIITVKVCESCDSHSGNTQQEEMLL